MKRPLPKPSPKPAQVRLSLRLDAKLYFAVSRFASANNLTMTAVIRKILTRELIR